MRQVLNRVWISRCTSGTKYTKKKKPTNFPLLALHHNYDFEKTTWYNHKTFSTLLLLSKALHKTSCKTSITWYLRVLKSSKVYRYVLDLYVLIYIKLYMYTIFSCIDTEQYICFHVWSCCHFIVWLTSCYLNLIHQWGAAHCQTLLSRLPAKSRWPHPPPCPPGLPVGSNVQVKMTRISYHYHTSWSLQLHW